MRILLAFITVFSIFQAQAYCFIKGTPNQNDFTAEAFPIDLNSGDNELTQNINFSSNAINGFICEGDSTALNQFTLTAGQSNAEYYLIQQGKDKLYLKISLEKGPTSLSNIFEGDPKINHVVEELNHLQYKLKYSVQSHYSGPVAETITTNTQATLNNYIVIKPADCSVDKCGIGINSTQQYIYHVKIKPTFTPTTCTFKNQEINIPEISHQDIDSNDFVAPSSQPTLQCNSTTGVATSSISYHFQPVTRPSQGILVNELGVNPGSAGEIGFKLKNKDTDITFDPGQKFTVADFGENVENNTIVPLDLKIRYARYGDHVITGMVQSKVKVVVDYD